MVVRVFGVAGLLIAAFLGGPAAYAQENLDSGKTPAQLFASDCSFCHKTPQGLAKAAGAFGLTEFLREHYTASRQSAAALAAYLQAAGDAPPPSAKPKRAAKPKGEAKKPDEKKSGDQKADEKKAGEKKPDAKPAETKPAEAKPSEKKPAEAKPSESKPAEAKPSETKPSESKTDKP